MVTNSEEKPNLSGSNEPEIVIGLVGALGAPFEPLETALNKELKKVGYQTDVIKLSGYLRAYDNLKTPDPKKNSTPEDRFSALMDRGNQLREKIGSGDALAMHAASYINGQRPGSVPNVIENKAFILHQLKHPDEVFLLREIYGDAFHLIGIYTSEHARLDYLNKKRKLADHSATQLIERDASEEFKFGQQVTKTFHLADFFVEAPTGDTSNDKVIADQVERYIDLIFGRKITTPSRDEYGMQLAYSAALRSGDLSRQVGAAILTQEGEILGLGSNEVPASGGGQYWEGAQPERDVERGVDSNEELKLECLEEVLEVVSKEWKSGTVEDNKKLLAEISIKLKHTRLMNLTEFGRAVHAEMEAILSAARVGVSVRGTVLYTTTFPCHNCAKHIIGAGIERAYYIEPYAKSLASRLHGDAIDFQLEGDSKEAGKVNFSPFKGVAPRRFSRLFSSQDPDGRRLLRKETGGLLKDSVISLRLKASPMNHIDRESIVAGYLNDKMASIANPKNGDLDA